MAKNKQSLFLRNRNFLLDAHAFIWAMEDSHRLSPEIKKIITDPTNRVLVSVGSIWEIVIKRKAGKIKLSFDIESSLKRAGFTVIPIQIEHALCTERLPLYHKDPFDRILIAQAQIEHLTLITSDQKIWKYKVDVLKC